MMTSGTQPGHHSSARHQPKFSTASVSSSMLSIENTKKMNVHNGEHLIIASQTKHDSMVGAVPSSIVQGDF